MKTIYLRKEVVAVHQTDPGYGDGLFDNPNLYLGDYKLSDFFFKKYEKIGGYGDNGVFSISDSDYLEYAITAATFDLPADDQGSYEKESLVYSNGKPGIGHQTVFYIFGG